MQLSHNAAFPIRILNTHMDCDPRTVPERAVDTFEVIVKDDKSEILEKSR